MRKLIHTLKIRATGKVTVIKKAESENTVQGLTIRYPR